MSVRAAALGVVGAVVGFLLPPGNVAGAVALGAAGYQAGANLDAADKSVAAAQRNQELQNQQANEVMQRADENTKAIMSDAEVFKGNQESAIVKGGVDVSSSSSLVALENAHANFVHQAYNESKDASLTAARIRAQAQNDVDATKAGRQAAQIGAATSVLGAAASVYSNKVSTGAAPAAAAPSGGGSYGQGTGRGSYRMA
jgi:hypothetical protein